MCKYEIKFKYTLNQIIAKDNVDYCLFSQKAIGI